MAFPLIATAFLAWYLSSFYLSSPMGAGSAMVLPIATMGSMFSSPDSGMVASFLLLWTVGMVAMMFPAMIPVISIYSRLMPKEDKRSGAYSFLGSAAFLAGYLALYTILGFVLFGVVYIAFQLGSFWPWLSSFSIAGVAAVLALAGIWQLSSLKEKMLAKCISPLGFFLAHSRKGLAGAVEMGAQHGAYCVGCCWLYMMVMLAVAAMSLFSMVLLSGLIILEKAFFGGRAWFRYVSAGIFFLLALAVVAFPSILAP